MLETRLITIERTIVQVSSEVASVVDRSAFRYLLPLAANAAPLLDVVVFPERVEGNAINGTARCQATVVGSQLTKNVSRAMDQLRSLVGYVVHRLGTQPQLLDSGTITSIDYDPSVEPRQGGEWHTTYRADITFALRLRGQSAELAGASVEGSSTASFLQVISTTTTPQIFVEGDVRPTSQPLRCVVGNAEPADAVDWYIVGAAQPSGTTLVSSTDAEFLELPTPGVGEFTAVLRRGQDTLALSPTTCERLEI